MWIHYGGLSAKMRSNFVQLSPSLRVCNLPGAMDAVPARSSTGLLGAPIKSLKMDFHRLLFANSLSKGSLRLR